MSGATDVTASGVPLLEVSGLGVSYRVRHRGRSVRVGALRDVSFTLERGTALGIVGESGSGKSTLARALMRLIEVERGSLSFQGQSLLALHGAALQRQRSQLQMIFQDGVAALDPRQRVGGILTEPLAIFRPQWSPGQRRERALALLAQVGLEPEHMQRFAHELSGGQAQRIGIARALIVEPQLVVCDEPLAALDVTVKSQITALLAQFRQRLGLSLLFIAHDLPAVQLLCDRVLVLYLGRVMEIGPCAALFHRPRHPYTRALLQSIPIPDPRLARARRGAPIIGDMPSSLSPPSGCVFRSRCPHAIERCAQEVPELRPCADSHVACHRADELTHEPSPAAMY